MADLHQIPTVQNEMLAAVESLVRLTTAMVPHAGTIARNRRVMFVAYTAAGFTEAQALELCARSTL